jgi:hypothetical protein
VVQHGGPHYHLESTGSSTITLRSHIACTHAFHSRDTTTHVVFCSHGDPQCPLQVADPACIHTATYLLSSFLSLSTVTVPVVGQP